MIICCFARWRGEAGLPAGHEHEPSDDVVRHHRLDVAAADEVDEGLVVFVPHLRVGPASCAGYQSILYVFFF